MTPPKICPFKEQALLHPPGFCRLEALGRLPAGSREAGWAHHVRDGTLGGLFVGGSLRFAVCLGLYAKP